MLSLMARGIPESGFDGVGWWDWDWVVAWVVLRVRKVFSFGSWVWILVRVVWRSWWEVRDLV